MSLFVVAFLAMQRGQKPCRWSWPTLSCEPHRECKFRWQEFRCVQRTRLAGAHYLVSLRLTWRGVRTSHQVRWTTGATTVSSGAACAHTHIQAPL